MPWAKSCRLSASRMIELVGVILMLCKVTPGAGFDAVGVLKLVFTPHAHINVTAVIAKASARLLPTRTRLKELPGAFRIASPKLEWCYPSAKLIAEGFWIDPRLLSALDWPRDTARLLRRAHVL